MRRIAIINQKGGVGKTTTATNLGAALARAGKRVVVVDMDPQANLSLYLGCEARSGEPTIYGVLVGGLAIQDAMRSTRTPGLWLIPSHIDLSGAELELAATIGRETVLRDALDTWEQAGAEVPDRNGESGPIDYLLLDCPPSLGLLSINALASAYEVLISVQTEFFALQGLGKLVEVIQLMQRRLNPRLELTGLLPNLYDNRLKLAREVLGELRRFFPGKVYSSSIRSNVKLAESPSHSLTIFEYAPDSNGAKDYSRLAEEVILQEAERDAPALTPSAPGSSEELLAAAVALREIEQAKRAEAKALEEAEEAEAQAQANQAQATQEREEPEEPQELDSAEDQPQAAAEEAPEPENDEAEPESRVEAEPDGEPSAAAEEEEAEDSPEPLHVLEPQGAKDRAVPEPVEPDALEAPEEPEELDPDPLVVLEAPPAGGPLPFGVVIPPGPNSRVEFRAAASSADSSSAGTALLDVEDEAEALAEREATFEADELETSEVLDELDEEGIEDELDGLLAGDVDRPSLAQAAEAPLEAIAFAPAVVPASETEPLDEHPIEHPIEPEIERADPPELAQAEPEAVPAASSTAPKGAARALPVYSFGDYIGEDRSRRPGRGGPATTRA